MSGRLRQEMKRLFLRRWPWNGKGGYLVVYVVCVGWARFSYAACVLLYLCLCWTGVCVSILGVQAVHRLLCLVSYVCTAYIYILLPVAFQHQIHDSNTHASYTHPNPHTLRTWIYTGKCTRTAYIPHARSHTSARKYCTHPHTHIYRTIHAHAQKM
jgi:hypothetical protein